MNAAPGIGSERRRTGRRVAGRLFLVAWTVGCVPPVEVELVVRESAPRRGESGFEDEMRARLLAADLGPHATLRPVPTVLLVGGAPDPVVARITARSGSGRSTQRVAESAVEALARDFETRSRGGRPSAPPDGPRLRVIEAPGPAAPRASGSESHALVVVDPPAAAEWMEHPATRLNRVLVGSLTQPALARALDAVDLYEDASARMTRREAVALLRSALAFETRAPREGELLRFVVRFRDDDPEAAQAVADWFADALIADYAGGPAALERAPPGSG